jgi:hypothetical protein
MNERMDRSRVEVSTHELLQQEDREYWAGTTVEERLQTVTYLRECFYGPEATTGRLRRLYQVTELE